LAGRVAAVALLAIALMPASAIAQEADVSAEMFTVNNTWMLVATFLVFIMHLGFACLECGLTQAKNTVNILFKNTGVIAIGLLTYSAVGFNLMYPGEFAFRGYLGFAGFGLDPGTEGTTIAYADGAYT
jgi:Amt family ammonium transporter